MITVISQTLWLGDRKSIQPVKSSVPFKSKKLLLWD